MKGIGKHSQGQVEGGFMGRTNKLVDGCYSFWQGGIFPLLQRLWPEYLAQTRVPGKLFLHPAAFGMSSINSTPGVCATQACSQICSVVREFAWTEV